MADFRTKKPDFYNAVYRNWPSWTPTFDNDGAGGPATYSLTRATYYQIGKIVYFTVEVVITAAGGASGALTFTLPSTPAYSSDVVICSGRETASTGNMLFGYWDNSASNVRVAAYSAINGGATIFTNSYNHLITGAYRIA